MKKIVEEMKKDVMQVEMQYTLKSQVNWNLWSISIDAYTVVVVSESVCLTYQNSTFHWLR